MHIKNGCKDLKRYPQISRRVRDTLARLFSSSLQFQFDELFWVMRVVHHFRKRGLQTTPLTLQLTNTMMASLGLCCCCFFLAAGTATALPPTAPPPPPVRHYACINLGTQCALDPTGTYTTPNCDGKASQCRRTSAARHAL